MSQAKFKRRIVGAVHTTNAEGTDHQIKIHLSCGHATQRPLDKKQVKLVDGVPSIDLRTNTLVCRECARNSRLLTEHGKVEVRKVLKEQGNKHKYVILSGKAVPVSQTGV